MACVKYASALARRHSYRIATTPSDAYASARDLSMDKAFVAAVCAFGMNSVGGRTGNVNACVVWASAKPEYASAYLGSLTTARSKYSMLLLMSASVLLFKK